MPGQPNGRRAANWFRQRVCCAFIGAGHLQSGCRVLSMCLVSAVRAGEVKGRMAVAFQRSTIRLVEYRDFEIPTIVF